MENYKKWLGREVEVIVDRPFGSIHPKHKNLVYKLNYGYLPGEISEFDNEEIDAYIMGVDKKLEKFTGQVIAIVKRLSGDKEIKLVVAKKNYSEHDIKKSVDFQEKYFRNELIMP